MTPRKAAEYVLAVLALVLVGALVMGQLLGQPVLLSYVKTGSMAPTLQPGDGFIAIPMAVAGPVEEGDVITFRAQELHGGDLTTHRVVGKTDEGYITKGDANPTTDQDGEEPPVKRAQIVAKALQIGGNVVVLPGIGLLVVGVSEFTSGFQTQLATVFNTRALLGTQGLAIILFVVGVGSYVASELANNSSGRARDRDVSRRRDGIDPRLIVAGLTVLLVLFVTVSMTVGGGSQEFGVVSSSTDAPGPGVIKSGGSESFTYRVPSNGVLPVVVFLEPASEGIDIDPREHYVPPNSVRRSIIELHAPQQRGYYRRYMVEHRYIAILPRGVIRALYEVHPWTPIVVIDLILGVGFGGLGMALIGGGSERVRSRELPLRERLRRWLR